MRGAPLPASAWSGPDSGSDVGSLFPFIQSQAVKGEFPLSFLRGVVHATWRPGSGRPAASCWSCCTTPRRPATRAPEVVERVDRGDHVREKVFFNTTPDVRVPAFVLVPKKAERARARRVVALHDHGGFYLWGKEKLVETRRTSTRS